MTLKLATISLALATVISAGAQNALITERDIPRLLKELTLEQKARLLVGVHGTDEAPSHYTPGAAGWTYPIHSLGIPSINLADGPVGPRINPLPWNETVVFYDSNGIPHETNKATADGSGEPSWCTAFPSTTALAASFDPEMARAQGETMGREAAAYGVDVLLTPGVNIVRNPLCGRNFEYYSEDPYLTGVLAAELIKGVQSQGVGTSLKHFVANNQQTGKKYNDARMTQRALREIYLPAFELCVREAHPWTVMGSYNKIGGQFTQTNPELMQKLLRDEWGYDGLVLTDWTVRRPTVDLLNARVALMMPGEEEIVQEIIGAVNSGAVTMETLDACVSDILRLDARSLTAKGWQKGKPDLAAGAALSRRLGAEAMVLLKNDDSTLPLSKGAKIALFGTGAYMSIAGGTGSSNVNKEHIVDIDQGLINAGFKVDTVNQSLYRRYNETQALLTDKYPGCPDWQKISYHRPVIDEMDLSKAGTYLAGPAKNNDAAVIVVSRKSGETSDRRIENDFNLSADEQTMIKMVTETFHAVGKPVVLVLNVCGMMETASWRDMPDAIVVAWFPGQECGDAVADVLSGKINPSGRLPITFPVHYADLPSSRNYPYIGQTEGKNFDYTNYEEDIWVGYRYFDTAVREVAYPFGYGLSYTDFEYGDARISRKGEKTTISVTVTNTGKLPGREVVQLYVSAPVNSQILKPSAELRGFAKTRTLAPGESERISITLNDDRLASFDEANSQWKTDKGTYTAHLGHHVGNYILSLPFEIKKEKTRKVANILAPVKAVKTIQPTPDPYGNMSWHKGTEFLLLGRCYQDSLPLYTRIPSFLKADTRKELYELGQHTTGMAIRFRSDSPKLALRWESLTKNDMTHMASLASRGADLYYLNNNGEWRFLAPARPMGDPTTWMIIENMEPEMHEYMLHLPLYDGLKSLEIGIADGSTIETPAIDSPRADRKPIVIYGSSIAHGATASRPGMAASNILRRELDTETINLGFSANAHLDYEIARMMADVDASVYVLDFVPNALVPEINEKTEEFVRILRERHPSTPLIFIEDPYFTHSQLDTKIKSTIDAKNQAIRAMYDKMVNDGMTNTYYVTAAEIVPADGEGSSDSIHFTDSAFRTYCDALLPILRKILE